MYKTKSATTFFSSTTLIVCNHICNTDIISCNIIRFAVFTMIEIGKMSTCAINVVNVFIYIYMWPIHVYRESH